MDELLVSTRREITAVLRNHVTFLPPNATRSLFDRLRLIKYRSEDNSGTRLHRRKRALLDLIGDASKYLFGIATQLDVGKLQHHLAHAEASINVLYHNQHELVSVVNLTRQQAIRNHNDIRGIRRVLTDVANSQKRIFNRLSALETVSAISILLDRVDVVVDILTDQWRRHTLICGALRNGRLSPFLLSDSNLQGILARFPDGGSSLPIAWYRTYADVQVVSTDNGVTTAVCDLWIRKFSIYWMWTFHSFWVYTASMFYRLRVHSRLLIDDTHSDFYVPEGCKGCNPILCTISHVRDLCEPSLFDATFPTCPQEWTRRGQLVISRREDDVYVVQPNVTVTLGIQCSDNYPREKLFHQPTLLTVDEQCLVTWPGGRSLPVTHPQARVNVTRFLPPKWTSFSVDSPVYEELSDGLRIHEQLVFDPNRKIVLTPLPSKTPYTLYYASWRWWCIVIVAVVVLVISVCLVIRWRVMFIRHTPPPVPPMPAEPDGGESGV